jgi:guanyl-specific ribonuclease Sa
MSLSDRSHRSKSWQKPVQYLLIAVIFGIALYNSWQQQQAPRATTTKPASEIAADKTEPSPWNEVEDKTPPTSFDKSKSPPATTSSVNTQQSKLRTKIENQTIRNIDGEVIFRGTVDVSKTLDRIQLGQRLSKFRHDGITFENREQRLPQRESGYYREWVHPTPGESGPGPQRVISGNSGEFWYTSNHYRTFIKLNE